MNAWADGEDAQAEMLPYTVEVTARQFELAHFRYPGADGKSSARRTISFHVNELHVPVRRGWCC